MNFELKSKYTSTVSRSLWLSVIGVCIAFSSKISAFLALSFRNLTKSNNYHVLDTCFWINVKANIILALTDELICSLMFF